MEKTLSVRGMHCHSCEMLLKDVLEEIPGVEVRSVDHKKGAIVAEFPSEESVEEAKKRIKGEGYKVE